MAEDGYLGNKEHVIWAELPQLNALPCKSVIETAKANVTVETQTGHVPERDILADP